MHSGKSSAISTNSAAFILSTNFDGTGGTAASTIILPPSLQKELEIPFWSCNETPDSFALAMEDAWKGSLIRDTAEMELAGGIRPSFISKELDTN